MHQTYYFDHVTRTLRAVQLSTGCTTGKVSITMSSGGWR